MCSSSFHDEASPVNPPTGISSMTPRGRVTRTSRQGASGSAAGRRGLADVRAIRNTHDDGHMWVRLMNWMIADGEPPLPNVGSLLTGVGLRVHGEVTAAPPDSPDGIVQAQDGHPHEVMYRLT